MRHEKIFRIEVEISTLNLTTQLLQMLSMCSVENSY